MIGIIVACGGALIAAITSIVSLLLNRKWQKEDRSADKLDAITAEVGQIKKTLNDHIENDAENDARQARRRIIVFADECRRKVKHSEEHFDNVLDDITFYQQFCDDHPKFKNKKAEQSIAFVLEISAECKRNNDYI